MPPKKLPVRPIPGVGLLWLALVMLRLFWAPTEMSTVTYHLLVNNALLFVGVAWAVYTICYLLWLNHYYRARRNMLANLAAADRYIRRGVISARCLCDSEAEEHMLAARDWQAAEPQVPSDRGALKRSTA